MKKISIITIIAICLGLTISCSSTVMDEHCGILKEARYISGGWGNIRGWEITLEDGFVCFVCYYNITIQFTAGKEVCLERVSKFGNIYWREKR